jgi:hypothetical protein
MPANYHEKPKFHIRVNSGNPFLEQLRRQGIGAMGSGPRHRTSVTVCG